MSLGPSCFLYGWYLLKDFRAAMAKPLQVKWADKHGGYGEHFYDYNHGPKHQEGYHDKHVVEHAPVYKPHHA